MPTTASQCHASFVRAMLGLALLLPSLATLGFAASPPGPAGRGSSVAPVEPVEAPEEPPARSSQAGAPVPRATALHATQLYPEYEWPMERGLRDGLMIVNYVDHDATTAFRDYMNGAWTYDGHRGTDIALGDFRSMDRGMSVRAAAGGTVTTVVSSHLQDRNCAAPDNSTLNYIEVANGDGTYTYYLHLRANSATVNVGEPVQVGQMIGLAGSSGYSTGPHLHFEAGDYLSGGVYRARDPWFGPMNPFPGLWTNQEPYNGTQHLWVCDMGVTTQAAVGGNLGAIDYCARVAERLQQPAVLGIHEPYLPVWFYPQGLAGDSYRIEIRRPNNTLYSSVEDVLQQDVHGGYSYWYWEWNGFVTAVNYGTWVVNLLVDGSVRRQVAFTVGPSTAFGPRLTRSGRSFRINGATQRDTLHATPLGGPVSYALLGAPGFVSLADSIVTIEGASTQPTRSLYFQVIATDASARRDTAWYHVVDPSKPQAPSVDASLDPGSHGLALAPNAPNPFAGATTLRYAITEAGRVALVIYDLAGRRVRILLDRAEPAGARSQVTWDGRDAHGRRAPGGVYLARLTTPGGSLTRRLVRLD